MNIMNRKISLPRRQLGLIWQLVLTVPLALLETGLALYIQPGPLGTICRYFLSHLNLLLLNFLPFWLLTLCAAFLFSNSFYGAALVGTLGGVLSLINRTMVEKRDEPLTPKDFRLIKEAGNAVQSYDLSLHIPSLMMILCFLALMLLLGFFFRGKRPFGKGWKSLCLSLGGAAACVCVLVGSIRTVYASKELYNSFPVRAKYYIAGVFEQLGFPYCFCYNFNQYLVEKPQGFSAGEAAGYASQHPVQQEKGAPVNVVMVMNEAFSDLTNSSAFAYPKGQEPLRFFNSLENDENALTGHIVVPNFGAGTANTEFDVITGMQTNLIGGSNASAFRVLNKDIGSIFRVFLKDGYQTSFIHPGEPWFYNRQNVYRYFGAEKEMFIDDMDHPERLGNWVSDEAVLEIMKEEFEAAVSEGEPYFNYTVTIQNHMSYSEAKYGDLPIEQAPLSHEVEEKAQSMLSVYAKGVRDADAMLQKLTEYYSKREEPVLLVFFGDHLPNLGDSYYAYRQLGIPIGEGKDPATTLYTYETPFVLWVNDAAEKALDFSARKEALELPENGVINANYLGAVVLELTGRRDSDSFFSYLNDLRRSLPVYHKGTGMNEGGELFEELPPQYEADMEKLSFWEYYRLQVE